MVGTLPLGYYVIVVSFAGTLQHKLEGDKLQLYSMEYTALPLAPPVQSRRNMSLGPG